MENEELQLNDEYKTQLQAEDVDRILKLPREIQLALPHLKSASEVEAHKLLTTYTLEYGEAEFAKADEQSQDHMFSVPSGEVRSARCILRIVALRPVSLARITPVAQYFSNTNARHHVFMLQPIHRYEYERNKHEFLQGTGRIRLLLSIPSLAAMVVSETVYFSTRVGWDGCLWKRRGD